MKLLNSILLYLLRKIRLRSKYSTVYQYYTHDYINQDKIHCWDIICIIYKGPSEEPEKLLVARAYVRETAENLAALLEKVQFKAD